MAFNESAARNCFTLTDHDVAEMNEEQREAYRIGIAVHDLLPTKYLPGGKVHTALGAKTAIRLGRSVLHLVIGRSVKRLAKDGEPS